MISKQARSASKQIEDDTAFEQEEKWLEDCQNAFLELETNALDYIKLNVEKGNRSWNEIQNPSTDNNGNQGEMETLPTDNNGDQNNRGENGENENESVEHGATETPPTNSTNTATTASLTNHNVIISGVGSNREASNGEAHNHGHTPCGFKMEKSRFNGDVRDYAIFRADFNHAIDNR